MLCRGCRFVSRPPVPSPCPLRCDLAVPPPIYQGMCVWRVEMMASLGHESWLMQSFVTHCPSTCNGVVDRPAGAEPTWMGYQWALAQTTSEPSAEIAREAARQSASLLMSPSWLSSTSCRQPALCHCRRRCLPAARPWVSCPSWACPSYPYPSCLAARRPPTTTTPRTRPS